MNRVLDAVREGLHRLILGTVLLNPAASHVIHQFRRAGALTPELAQPFHADSSLDLLAFRGLLSIGVIQQPRPGRYFLDERVLKRLGAR